MMRKLRDVLEEKIKEAISKASDDSSGQINLSSESAQINLARHIISKIEKDLERWPSGRRHWS